MKTPAEQLALNTIISHHLDRYPGLAVTDLYKLIYQAAMGSEHAVADADQAERRLRAEAESMAPMPTDAPMTDPVSPDHRLVRVHLHPYLARGGRIADLARAFIQTSRTFKPSVRLLSTYWNWTAAMAHGDDWEISADQLVRFGEKQRKADYPSVHHSAQYRRLYQPAYRVVLTDLLDLPLEI
jgi:plasmid stabilization system protein ParE